MFHLTILKTRNLVMNLRMHVKFNLQAIIKEEFSYYSSSGPKYEKFSKHLTVREMVRLHFDPYTSSFDLSKQPILVLEKVTVSTK